VKVDERDVAKLIVDKLMLTEVNGETMDLNASLVDTYGLDSLDFLELAMAISKQYGVEFTEGDEENAKHFHCVHSISAYIQQKSSNRQCDEDDLETKIFKEVASTLHAMFEFPTDDLKYETQLVADLDLDSLDALDLVACLHESLGVHIPDKKLMKLQSVGDIVKVVLEIKEKE